MKKYFKWEYLVVFLIILSYNIYSKSNKYSKNETKALKTSFKEFLKKEYECRDLYATVH